MEGKKILNYGFVRINQMMHYKERLKNKSVLVNLCPIKKKKNEQPKAMKENLYHHNPFTQLKHG